MTARAEVVIFVRGRSRVSLSCLEPLLPVHIVCLFITCYEAKTLTLKPLRKKFENRAREKRNL